MTKSNKKICIITGGRADYDLLKPLMEKLKVSKNFNLKIAATGSHFLKNQNTYKKIKKDGLKINYKIKINYKDDTNSSILNFLADGIKKFNNLFKKEKFNAILVLGDRYEIFSAVISASFYRIPIIHLSGGEVTEGAIDESIRHSITKFSSYHFVAHSSYKNRVKQLGENPKNIFTVGGTGVEDIYKINLLSKKEIEKKFKFKFGKENYLVTFHPVTFEPDYGINQLKVLLYFLSKKKEATIIFTLPNSDINNYKIINLIKNFVNTNKKSRYFLSLGKKNYFSIIKHINAVVGNSSSGLSEVPSFKKPTINLGNRQKGRISTNSVINIDHVNMTNLKKAFDKINRRDFKRKLIKVKNPYFQKNTSKKIINILNKLNLKKTNLKKFNDLKKI